MNVYLVGGAVRDLLLGRSPREHDVAFEGDAACFLRQNPRARKVGRDIAVYLLDGVEYMPLRGTIDEDLAARDFTINALALTETGVLRAHPQALEDLSMRCLRPASATALADSPVRAFRAARFAAQFPDFHVHPETLVQMRTLGSSGALAALPAEQVCRETMKALAAPCPGRYLRVLHAGQCLAPWFAELSDAAPVPAGPLRYHSGSVLDHTIKTMNMAAALATRPEGMTAAGNGECPPAGQTPRELVTWMALCHDLGKITTEPDVLPHHYGHEERGAPVARMLGSRLSMPTRFIEAGEAAARLHMRLGRHGQLRPGTKVDLLMELHTRRLLGPMCLLVVADGAACAGGANGQSGSEGTTGADAADRHAPLSIAAGTEACAAQALPRLSAAIEPALAELRRRTGAELAALLAVSLPPAMRNKGEASGAHLRELRCVALSRQGT